MNNIEQTSIRFSFFTFTFHFTFPSPPSPHTECACCFELGALPRAACARREERRAPMEECKMKKGLSLKSAKSLILLARPAGFEPATYGFVGRKNNERHG